MLNKTRVQKEAREEQGFTIVELMMVAMISLIMLAGMVALVSSVFNVFRQSNDLQALNDTSRRALASMSRQLKTALHFDNTVCNPEESDRAARTIGFWADVDNDQTSNPAQSPSTWVGIDSYKLAEKVVFAKSPQEGIGRVTMALTQPAVDPDPQGTTTATLGSYVSELKFYFFRPGLMPGGEDPTAPTECMEHDSNINAEASMIRIVLKLQKGKVNKTYYQDVFLRIVQRHPDY
jgi:type II secretory pathway component PulJ